VFEEYAQVFYSRDLNASEKTELLKTYRTLSQDSEWLKKKNPQDLWIGVCVHFATSFDFLKKR
jgi:hypothetical protein